MYMNNSKKWCICSLALALALMVFAGTLTAVIDPFFHYHAPLNGLQYPLNNQRYQNDGIVKNFPYDALITGTSMTENFKTSEFDALFGVNSIKVSFSGGTYEEINSNLQRAIEANPELKIVIYGLDEWFLFAGKSMILADGEYPTYLYDNNPFNDVEYLLNKDVLCNNTVEVLNYTRSGQTTTSFDAFGSWDGSFPYDAANVISNYTRAAKVSENSIFTEELQTCLSDTILNTAVKLARENPEIQFIYFFPPYSILNWDNHNQSGTLQRQIEAFTLASQLLLEADNIALYSFYNDYGTITNLNLYRDTVHYSGEINSLILQRIHNGEYKLTRENYSAYWQEILDFYQSYDYDAIFQTETA